MNIGTTHLLNFKYVNILLGMFEKIVYYNFFIFSAILVCFSNIIFSGIYTCQCSKKYTWLQGLRQHQRHECGKEAKFQCPYCEYKCKFKFAMKKHIAVKHCQPVAF